jgi:hypothetical protein
LRANSLATNMVILPGIVALLLFLDFTYLLSKAGSRIFARGNWVGARPPHRADALNARQSSAWIYLASFPVVVMALFFVSRATCGSALCGGTTSRLPWLVWV